MKKLLLIGFIALAINVNAQIVTTLAGDGTAGYSGDGGPSALAQMNAPTKIVLDAGGNLYFSDLGNYCVRKISTSGIITTFAGTPGSGGYSGDGGSASSAQLYQPQGLTFDASGNLYIADSWNNVVRMVNPSGIITTIAGNATQGYSGDGGLATSASFNDPFSIAIDATGNIIIADGNNHCIRKVNTSGIISTVAGNGAAGFSGDGGPASAAQLNSPGSMVFDATGNLYIADEGNNRIRMINTSGIITTIAGTGTTGGSGNGGPATSATLDGIAQITFDAQGNLFIAGFYNHAIRKINTSGIIDIVAGNGGISYSPDGGLALATDIGYPNGVAVDPAGNIYFAEWANNRVRFICSTPDTISGLITEPNSNPVTAGQVFIFRQNLIHAGLLDTAGYATINSNGTYAFPNLPFGNYFVEAIADPFIYTNAVGTYYSTKMDNYRWDSAIFVSHNGCANNTYSGYNITIIEPPAQTGTGLISGTVYGDVGFGQRMSGGHNTVQGSPLKGVDIKLGKNPGGCAAKTTTSATGTYTFTNVDIGNYFVYVDVPNYIDTIVNISITSGNQTSLNVDYCIDSANVKFCGSFTTGMVQSAVGSKRLMIFPNPAINNITVQSEEELGSIIVYNSLGEIVFKMRSENTQEQFDTGKLIPGIYVVLVQGRSLKIVKE